MLAACIAQFGRSTASVIVGGLLFLGIDLGIRLGLSGLAFMGVSLVAPLKSGLFGTAVSQWSTSVEGFAGCCSRTGLLGHRPHHPRLAPRRSHGGPVMMDTFMVFV